MASKRLRPVHPGEILRHEFLDAVGMTPYALAKALGVSIPTVNQLARGRRSISADMALRLARYWRTTPQFWMNLQSQFDLAMAEDAKGSTVRREVRPRDEDDEVEAA